MECRKELIRKWEGYGEGLSVVGKNECMRKGELVGNVGRGGDLWYEFGLGNKRRIVIINGRIVCKSIEINDDRVVVNGKDVWRKCYYESSGIDVIRERNLELRMIDWEGVGKKNNWEWIFGDKNLNGEGGKYLVSVGERDKVYVVWVFYIRE